MITGAVAVFIPRFLSRCLYFESFSTVFKEVFLSVGIDISMSGQLIGFLIFHHYVWSVCFYLLVSLD